MNPTPSPERPEPPEGYRLIPREYLEAGNMLPEDALFTGPGFGGWCKSGWRGHPIGEREDIDYLTYATRTPAPEAVAGELGELGDKTCDGKCCERWASLADGSSCPCPICHPPTPPADKDAEKYPEHGVLIEHRDGRMWVYPIEGGDFIWNGDPTFNAISCAKFTRQVADLRSTNHSLLAMAQQAAQQNNAQDEQIRSLERRCAELEQELENYRPVAEAKGATKAISQRDAALAQIAALSARVAELESSLAEARKDGQWRPIATAPKDGTEFIANCWEAPEDAVYKIGWDCNEIDGGRWRDVWSNEKQPTHWMPLPAMPETKE